MARNLISSGSHEDLINATGGYAPMDERSFMDNPGNPPGGGVIAPEPERVERTRDYTTPGGLVEKKMTPEERKLPLSGKNMGSSDPELTPPIHERTVTPSGRHGITTSAEPGTGIAELDRRHEEEVQSEHDRGMAAGAQKNIAMSHPTNFAPPGGSVVHADPFSNPDQYRAVPGTNKMEYTGGGQHTEE